MWELARLAVTQGLEREFLLHAYRATWLMELLVLALVARRPAEPYEDLLARRDATSMQLPSASSALLSVPLLTWAFETSVGFRARFEGPTGLTGPGLEYYFAYIVGATFALGLLAAVQSLACLVLGYREGRLGVAGRPYTAVKFAIAAAILDLFFVAWWMITP